MDVVSLFVVAALVVPPALIYPGWRRFDAALPERTLMLFFPALGAALWLLVTIAFAAIHVTGLPNLALEIPITAVIAVAIAYVKFLYLRPESRLGRYRIPIVFALLLIAIVVLRLAMPELGE